MSFDYPLDMEKQMKSGLIRIISIVTLTLLCSCSSKEEIVIHGVWSYAGSGDIYEYYEAHISDTGYVVFNENTLSYLASYKIKKDTMFQYVRDHILNLNIVDTLQFSIKLKADTLELVNISNSKLGSKWIRIDNVEPFEYEENQSIDSFLQNLEKRYLNEIKNRKSN